MFDTNGDIDMKCLITVLMLRTSWLTADYVLNMFDINADVYVVLV